MATALPHSELCGTSKIIFRPDKRRPRHPLCLSVMRKPQIVVVSHTYIVGANRGKFKRLSEHADVTIVAPLHWEDTLGRRTLDPLEAGMPYRLIGLPILFTGRLARHFYLPHKLGIALHAAHPDLVHIEEEPIGLAFLQVSALKRLLGCRLSCFTWQNILLPTTVVERINLSTADSAIVGNIAAETVLRRKRFQQPVFIAPQLGIPTGEVPPKKFSQPGFQIGYVGRLVPEKGLRVLMDALAELAGDWHCQIIGSGPLESELRESAASRGIDKRITFRGSVPHADVAGRLGSFDVLVLPSLTMPGWKEQFGHVLIEAMALGVPVVGSDSGAIPEVIADAGIIVPENDAVALRLALARLLSDPLLREELCRRGRIRSQQEYTDEEVAEKTWRCWQATLSA
jgi:glycosyltransferase involved in cell wall biosynthesis